MFDSPALQHIAQPLRLVDGNGADQHRLALFMALDNLLNDGVEFSSLIFKDHIGMVDPLGGLVGGDLDDVQLVNLPELSLLGEGGTGHTGQFLVHPKVVLEGDGGQGLGLPLHLDPFLGLNGLMESFVITAADHETAGKLVDDDDLAVLDHIVNIPVHNAVGPDGLVNMMLQRHVVGIHQVFYIKVGLRLLDAVFGQGAGLGLFVHDVVVIFSYLVLLLLLVVELLDLFAAEGAGKLIRHRV